MTADLFLGSLVILSMAAIVIVSLTTARDNNRDNDRRTSVHSRKDSGEQENAE